MVIPRDEHKTIVKQAIKRVKKEQFNALIISFLFGVAISGSVTMWVASNWIHTEYSKAEAIKKDYLYRLSKLDSLEERIKNKRKKSVKSSVKK